MKRLPILVAVLALFAAGCDDSPTDPSSDDRPLFVASLAASNEVPPVSNAESTATGTATVILNLTRNSAGEITAATADFNVIVSGLTATSLVNVAHIHEGATTCQCPVVVNTTLAAGQVPVSGGTASFQRSGISVTAAAAQRIVNNPAAFYFNIHSTLNPGGVARGQLARQGT